MAAKEAAARQAVESFIQKQNVEGIVQELIQKLLVAKPENPRQFLLNYLEKDFQAQDDELTETDLQKLFLVSRCITGKINPQETIRATIKETMGLLNCDAVSLYVLDRKMQMLRLYTHHAEFPIMLRLDHGIAGSVFLKQELVNIANCQQDSRFDRTMDMQTGYFTRSMLVVPILDIEGQGCGVIQAINKIPSGVEIDDTVHIGKSAVAFSVTDEKMLLHLVQNVAIAIQNAEIYREAINNSERATGLLNTIQSVSQDLGPQSLLLTVTTHASKVCSAERSTVFLVDEAMQQLWSVSTDTGAEIRIPKDKGIAGECCCHCTVINIPDAYADPRFNKQVDIQTGYRTRSILAIPIMSEDNSHVVGVIQMINKVSYDGQPEHFDEEDVEIMQLFATFVRPKLMLSASKDKDCEGQMALGGVKHPSSKTPAKKNEMSLGAFAEVDEDDD